MVLVVACFGGIYGLTLRTPTGFLPEEDQGAFFVAVQLPDGASVTRTREVVTRVEAIAKGIPQIQNVLAIVGFSLLDSGNQSNSAFLVMRMKPFADRKAASDKVQALIGRMAQGLGGIRSAIAFPFNLPPIIGLSTGGGFEYQLQNLEGREPAEMGSVLNGLLASANADPKLARVFSTFSATTPSIYLDIDREKAQALGLSISDVFTALQATLGGIYVNDLNLFGRTWQVNIQGDAADRTDIPAIWRIYIRNKQGTMVPLRSIADARIVLLSPPDWQLRAIADLVTGIGEGSLGYTAHRAGIDIESLERFVATLEPVLERVPRPLRSVEVAGGPGVDEELVCLVRHRLAPFAPLVSEGAPRPRGTIQVLVASHAVHPAAYAASLGDDVVHIPVVFTTTGITIGPRVEPGATACLACVDADRRDRDPAWPMIAAQLLTAPTPEIADHILVEAITMLAGFVSGEEDLALSGHSVTIPNQSSTSRVRMPISSAKRDTRRSERPSPRDHDSDRLRAARVMPT